MKPHILKKLYVLMIAVKVIKNWYLYPIVYFRLIKQKYVTFETRGHTKIKLRVNSTDLMALTNVWLIKEYLSEDFEINDGDIVIDIGAHIGLFALFAAQFNKKGKIFCFEPVIENYNLLLSNLELNNTRNIHPFNIAVTNKTSLVTIYLNEDDAAHSMIIPTSRSTQVKTTTLQKIFSDNNIERCDFLKLDCEGSEYDIINSMSNEHFKKIKKIAMEYHIVDNNSKLLLDLINKLNNYYYKIITKSFSDNMGFLYASENKLL